MLYSYSVCCVKHKRAADLYAAKAPTAPPRRGSQLCANPKAFGQPKDLVKQVCVEVCSATPSLSPCRYSAGRSSCRRPMRSRLPRLNRFSWEIDSLNLSPLLLLDISWLPPLTPPFPLRFTPHSHRPATLIATSPHPSYSPSTS